LQKVLNIKNVLITVILLLIVLFLYFYISVFMPLILALFTALALEPVVRLIKKGLRFKKRLPAVVITFIMFLIFLASLIYLSVTRLINEAVRFLDRLPYYIRDITRAIENLIEDVKRSVEGFHPAIIQGVEDQINYYAQQGPEIAKNAFEILASWVQGIPNLVILTIVYLITLFLISMDLPNLKERFFSLFKEENEKKVRYMLQRLGNVFVGFFKAQFLVSIVIFVVSYVGLLIISPRNAFIMALIIWIIDFIPIIGSIVILAPWALFSFISADPATGIKLLILAGILLTLRRTLEPMIMGDQIGLSALSTLIAIYLGLYFFGIIGLIVGPLAVITLKSAKEAGMIKSNIKL
jgi:sporulation integral membrane protein YtvI